MKDRHTPRSENASFLNGLISEHIQPFFQKIVDKRIGDIDLDHHTIIDLFPDYFNADKKFGSMDEESLLSIGLISIAYLNTDYVPLDLRFECILLGSSVLQEVAVLQTINTHNSLDTVDERLEHIDTSDYALEFAEKYSEETSEARHRVSFRKAFTQVYKDIVCGEITMETVSETLEKLALCRKDVVLIKNGAAARGLIGEIDVLTHLWKQYSKKGDSVAIPSTMRAGDGHFNRNDTHDIDVLRQKKDDSWKILTPIEVKRVAITEKIRNRYTGSLIAHVAVDGTVSITDSHRSKAS